MKKTNLKCCLCGNNIEGYGKTLSDGLDIEDKDSFEVKKRIDAGEDGVYVQTDELQGVIIFKNGSQYELEGTEDAIYATKSALKKGINVDIIVKTLMENADKEFRGISNLIAYGNNPAPIKTKNLGDVCCDECNYTKVIPARLGLSII
jgi:hypothetical protein